VPDVLERKAGLTPEQVVKVENECDRLRQPAMSDIAESSYRAADNGRRLRAFRPTSLGPNASLLGLPTPLARARHLARNDPWRVSALNKSVSNGIATGIQAKPIWGTKEHKKKVTKLWTRWGKYADADGVLV